MEDKEDVRETIAELQAQMAALMAKLSGEPAPAAPAAAPTPSGKRTLATTKKLWPREKPIEVEVTTSPSDRIKLALLEKCLGIKELAEITGLPQAQIRRDTDKLIQEKQVIDASSGETPLLTWNGNDDQKSRAHTLVRLLRVRWLRRRELAQLTGWRDRDLDNALVEVRRLKGPPYCWILPPSDYRHSPQFWVSDEKPPTSMNAALSQPKKQKK